MQKSVAAYNKLICKKAVDVHVINYKIKTNFLTSEFAF